VVRTQIRSHVNLACRAPVAGTPCPVTPDAASRERDRSLPELAENEPRRLRNGVISLVLLGVLVGALILAVPGLHTIGKVMVHAGPWWLVVAVVAEILSCLSYVLAFQLVFARAPRVLAARIALAELAFGAVLPVGGAGGVAIGAWIAKAKGISLRRFMERSAELFLLTSAVNGATLAVAGLLVGIGVLPGPHPLTLGLLPGAFGVAAILAFLLVLPIANRFPRREYEPHPPRAVRWLDESALVVRGTRDFVFKPRWRLIGAFGYMWFDIAALWLCFRAIGPGPSIGVLTLAYVMGYAANIVPIPGGVGAVDGGLIGALILYGFGSTQAAAAVLLYRVIALWIPTLMGLIALARLRPTLHDPVTSRVSPAAAVER
jgi:uncharacterized membrane protein YbhN (UPF0104 family)